MTAKFSEVSNSYYGAHVVKKGNSAFNGPYLDDIRAEEEAAYRAKREKEMNAAVEVPVEEVTDETEEVESEEETNPTVTNETVDNSVGDDSDQPTE